MARPDKQIEDIEAAQKALLVSIEQTKSLAENAEKLVQKHKQALKAPAK